MNPATGATTPVGNFGFGGGYMETLAFDPSTGTLFGMSSISSLYSINQATGAATLIGSTHNFNPFHAMACDNNGTLYGVDSDGYLLEINRSTAANMGGVRLAHTLSDIAFRPEDNVMFGTSYDSPGNASLYIIHPATGAITLVGTTGAGVLLMSGLAFSAVPEAASLSALTLVAGAAMAARFRRRPLRRP
ncbi:MAG: hypothetical protein H7Z14_10350 [Anaerolineae bacterium]|nr:hypothetical protein [Phycisphaerae bacterium]